MMKITKFTVCACISFLVFSCETKTTNETSQEPTAVDEVPQEEPAATANFRYETPENSYPDAILELHNPYQNQTFSEGNVPFEFNIKNFPFEHGRNGFQLKMIINGNDPIGYNMPIFRKEFATGTYKVLAYLVDEDGIALKEYGNYVQRDFIVGESNPFPESDDPFIAVNKPENGSSYDEGEAILVDFILVGGDLKEDGLSIAMKLDDMDYSLDELGLVKIDNLAPGEHTLSIALVDNKGKELPGIFTKSIKKFSVK